ncbi:MAG: putative ABC transporter permease [Eubacteriales bacterium]|nr:putative ABC transporter permease [Eubacteriales bacterium]
MVVVSLNEWILWFFIYAFIGWVFESIYCSIRENTLINRGFLRLPFLPLYGFGAIVMFRAALFKHTIVGEFFATMIAATLLEFFTGMIMEDIFKVKYWDYSNQKINYKGYICLSSSVLWGFFGVLLVHFIHPFFLNIISMIPSYLLTTIDFFLIIITFYDSYISVKVALDLKNIIEVQNYALSEMSKIKVQADTLGDKLKRRLDTTLTFYKEDIIKTKNQYEKIFPKNVYSMILRNPTMSSLKNNEIFNTKKVITKLMKEFKNKFNKEK